MNKRKGNEERSLRKWARQMSKLMRKLSPAHSQYLAALAKDGVPFRGFERAATEPDTKLWKIRQRPTPKECFFNAQNFVLNFPEAEYYEGLLLDTIMPVEHAWVVYKGKVFDFTLEAAEKAVAAYTGEVFDFTQDPEAVPVYLGLPVPRRFAAKVMAETGWSGPLGDRYYGGQGLKKSA